MPNGELVHTVAFRVTEEQWRRLQHLAGEGGTSIPQLAKAALLGKIGLEVKPLSRSLYGQKPRNRT